MSEKKLVYISDHDISKFAGQLSRKGGHCFCKTEWPRLAANRHLAIWNGPGLAIRMRRGHGSQPRHRSEAASVKPTPPSLEVYLRKRRGWPPEKQRVEGKISYLPSQASLLLNNGGREETFCLSCSVQDHRNTAAQSAGKNPGCAVIKRNMSMLLDDLPFYYYYLFLSFSNFLHQI